MLFDLNQKNKQVPAIGADHRAVDVSPIPVFCKSPSELQDLVDTVSKHKDVLYLSNGDWSMHDLLIMLMNWIPCADLYLSTYSITEFPLRQIVKLQEEERLQQVHILLDAKAKVRYPATFHLANNICNRIRLTQVHAKVMVLRTPSFDLSVMASSNWTENRRLETGYISRTPEVTAWYLNWLEKSLEHGNPF